MIVLHDAQPDILECKAFICKFIECSKEDYIKLKKHETPLERAQRKHSEEEMAYLSAKRFLFEDDYKIEFGNIYMGFRDMLEELEIIGEGQDEIERYRTAIQSQQDIFNQKN